MSSGPLAAAVVGLGAMGANHVRVYSEIEGARLVAVADASPGRLRLPSLPPDIQTYPDYNRMLAEERIDLLSVCVPTRLHLEVALATIEKGSHPRRKPIAASLDEGREMMAAAKAPACPS
jgi:UDP-N-acetylglucosamine 3-dehydrogenase